MTYNGPSPGQVLVDILRSAVLAAAHVFCVTVNICHAQAALEAFEANAIQSASVDDMSLTRWLESSFRALPSDQHRQMFLDAGTLMHAEPQAHLQATWVALLQLDRGHSPMSFRAAAYAVSRLFEDLLDSSLVMSTSQDGEQGGRCAQP